MKIEHLAIWVKDLEKMKLFYERNFGATAGALYHNPKKEFYSYFLTFSDGPRLEIMSKKGISEFKNSDSVIGLAHFAVSVGSKERVDQFTEELRSQGHIIKSEPRTTGDGYYESVVLDPEGNEVEITI